MKITVIILQLLLSQSLIANETNLEQGQNISRTKSKSARKSVDRNVQFLKFFFDTINGPKVLKILTNKYVSKDEAKKATIFLKDLNSFGDHFPMPEFSNEGRLITLKY
jgi:Ser/Thr protein kinase RdoA (MazF antagonist)